MNEDNEPETFCTWIENDIMLLPEEFFAELLIQTVHIVALDDSAIYTITKVQVDVIYSKSPEDLITSSMLTVNSSCNSSSGTAFCVSVQDYILYH